MKKLLLPLSILFVLFLILEGISFLYVRNFGNSLDKTRPIVGPDQILGWRHYPNLSTTFLDKSFTTDADGFRKVPVGSGKQVLFLGPSSTVGWGVNDEESYPALVASDFRVTNASQIGFSSFQGMKLFQNELRNKQFDYVVISYGINDVDMNRFYFQSAKKDSEELREPKSAAIVTSQKVIFTSSLFLVMHKIAFNFLRLLAPKPDSEELKKFIRVDEEEFRNNVEVMIRQAQNSGAIPIVLSTAFHFQPSKDPEVEMRQKLIIDRMNRYRTILDEVAKKEGALFADPETWLLGSRDKLFVDPVHFSPEGNRLIADGLKSIMVK